ncbi:unnamed protein product [Dicrocoelium dendriticum]|nr:unnamed protein product [Dicrocoelium dendriticum]
MAEGIKKQFRKLGWLLTQYQKKGHGPEDGDGKVVKRGSRKGKVLPEPTAGFVQRDAPSLSLWDSLRSGMQVDLEVVDVDGDSFDELVGPEIFFVVGPLSKDMVDLVPPSPEKSLPSGRQEEWFDLMIDTVVQGHVASQEPWLRSDLLLDLASNLRAGLVNLRKAQSSFEAILCVCFPCRWKSRTKEVAQPAFGQRHIRKVNYAKIQTLFRKKSKDAAKCVLAGTWREAYKLDGGLLVGDLEYWRSIIQTPGKEDCRPVEQLEENYGLLGPVGVAEIGEVLRKNHNTSLGPDGVTFSMLRRAHWKVLAQVFNVMLSLEAPANAVTLARIS